MGTARLAVLTVAGPLWWFGEVGRPPLPTSLPEAGYEPQEREDELKMPDRTAGHLRREALARAKLWREPLDMDLGENPPGPGGFSSSDEIACKFHPRKSSGATAKFECIFEGGEVLKVKYGRNPELHTEVAASRLLEALGAGADRMYLVKTLRCFGCPEEPHALLSCISSPLEEVRRVCQPRYGEVTAEGAFQVKVDYAKYVDFGPVAVERRLPGDAVEADDKKGWGWDELEDVQFAGGGATRAERDALRLLAVFLVNWDNRPDNQRLTCLPGPRPSDGHCPESLAYMHDVGGTFGRAGGASKDERKLDVEAWRAAPVWDEPRTCRVKITSPPLHGASFGEATISETGRRFLAERLARLSEAQVRALFQGARFADYEGASPASRDVGQWVSAFQEKVRQITEREPCRTP
jgi:hypothetical protein